MAIVVQDRSSYLFDKWDRRLLGLAEYVARWSHDPSTRTGAVIADRKHVVSVGYNGFPRGVDDDPARYADRSLKYKMIVHCEMNAILSAKRSVEGFTLYTWPFTCCPDCAGQVIQAGISRVVSPWLDPDSDLGRRWADDVEISLSMFRESGVNVLLVKG